MARSHATIYGSAWSPESSFCELHPEAQWLYIALLAQPDLNLCGVMPMIPQRWAHWAAGLDVPKLDALVADLEAAGYIVTDDRTVELWVRQFMHHDKVFAQPQVAMAAATSFGQVLSPKLRRLVTEAVPPGIRDGWPDNLRGIKRDQAKALLEGCDAASWKPPPPPGVSPNGSPTARGDCLGVDEALDEGAGYGSGCGSGTGSAFAGRADSETTPSTALARVASDRHEAGERIA